MQITTSARIGLIKEKPGVWSFLGFFLGLVLFSGFISRSSAGLITWNPVFQVTQATDIDNPVGGTLVEAIDYNEAIAPFDDREINDVFFTRVSITPWDNLRYDATFWPTPTDDVDLDSLMDSHAWTAGGSTNSRKG